MNAKIKAKQEPWRSTTLGEVLSISSGAGLTKSNRIDDGRYLVYGGNGVTGKHSEYLFEEEKLIIGRVGVNCGNAYITKPKSWVTDNAFVVTFNENEIDIRFLKELITYLNLNKYSSSTAQPVLSQGKIYPIGISIPPLIEQKAIVFKIEGLFSEIDKGIESLKLAQEQLKVYRQSVLKWAFEGRLTNEDVKEGELPKGWKWVQMKDVCIKIGDIDHKMPKQLSSGYPYVSTKDFTDDLKISFESAKFISKDDFISLSRKIKPEKGDIIFPRYGTIGKNILIDFDREFLVSYSCAVIKPDNKLVSSKFLYLFSLSPIITDEIGKYVVETTQANIGIASIKQFVFPLTSLKEQEKVVLEIESRLSNCDKMEESINQSLQHIEILRHSILKGVFEGRS